MEKFTLELATHSMRNVPTIIEIWQGTRFMGSIYPAEDGIRVISKHLDFASVTFEQPSPPTLNIPLIDKTRR